MQLNNQLSSKNSPFSFLRFNTQHYLVLAIIALSGTICFFLGDEKGNGVIRDIGVLLLTVFSMSFIYELVLRRLFQNEMKQLIKEAIQEATLKPVENILRAGIVDAFVGIDHGLINKWIEESSNTNIIVSNIYIPELTTRFDVQLYVNAIKERNCTLQILIYDCTDHEAIEKRAFSTNTTFDTYKSGIVANINSFRLLWEELQTQEYQNKISIRLHTNFISSSIWGFGNFFVIAFYHYKISAIQSVQLKIEKTTPGSDTKAIYFQQIESSFQEQWKKANKEVVFGKKSGMIWDSENGCNIVKLR